MNAFLATLRDGRWLSRERIRLWSLAVLAASALGFIFLVFGQLLLVPLPPGPLG